MYWFFKSRHKLNLSYQNLSSAPLIQLNKLKKYTIGFLLINVFSILIVFLVILSLHGGSSEPVIISGLIMTVVVFCAMVVITIKNKIPIKDIVFAFIQLLVLFLLQLYISYFLMAIYLAKVLPLSNTLEYFTHNFLLFLLPLSFVILPFTLVNANLKNSYEFKKKLINLAISYVLAYFCYQVLFIALIFTGLVGGFGGFYFIFALGVTGFVFSGFIMYSLPFLLAELLSKRIKYWIVLSFALLISILLPANIIRGSLKPMREKIIDDAEEKNIQEQLKQTPIIYPSYIPPGITLDQNLSFNRTKPSHILSFRCNDMTQSSFYVSQVLSKSSVLTGNEDFMHGRGLSGSIQNFYKVSINTENAFIKVQSFNSVSERSRYSAYWKFDGRLFTVEEIADTCFVSADKKKTLTKDAKDQLVIGELTKFAESFK